MTRRDLAKKKTRDKLFCAAKDVLARRGPAGTSTLDVARAARVAHGTVFFHFGNRENMITHIVNVHLDAMLSRVRTNAKGPHCFTDLVNTYLDTLEEDEGLYSALLREPGLLPGPARRTLCKNEQAIRLLFIRAIRKDVPAGTKTVSGISVVLTMLFGTVHYCLSGLLPRQQESGSMIRRHRNALIAAITSLLGEKGTAGYPPVSM